jgi:hypothetical protein
MIATDHHSPPDGWCCLVVGKAMPRGFLWTNRGKLGCLERYKTFVLALNRSGQRVPWILLGSKNGVGDGRPD